MKKLLLRVLCAFSILVISFFALRHGLLLYAKWDFQQQQNHLAENVENVFLSKGRLFLYSLNPSDPKGHGTNTDNIFHGFPILGGVEIHAADERRALVTSLANGIRENNGISAMCFNPRHGLRIVTDSVQRDLTICFQCGNIYSYEFNSNRGMLTTGTPNNVFNQILDKYGLPRAEKD
jgi:hypothetical protein